MAPEYRRSPRTRGAAIGTTQVVRSCRLRRGWREGGQLRGIDKRVAPTGHCAGVVGCHGLSRRYGGGDFRLFMLFPSARQHPRQEPSAVIPLAGICAGGRPKGLSLPRLIIGGRLFSLAFRDCTHKRNHGNLSHIRATRKPHGARHSLLLPAGPEYHVPYRSLLLSHAK